jgi:hypothetical protein
MIAFGRPHGYFSPTQARDTVEPIKHRLVFPSNKHFISFLTISFSFITYPIQMETIEIYERIILITYLSFIVKTEQRTFCVHGLLPIFVAPDC